jgi:LysM repeat protein
MKKILILFLAIPFFATAQVNPLLVEGISPALYLVHKVAPKENYYSIGRIYNISPKEIAPFNKLSLESGLSLGQVIKIPLTPANFYQNGNAEADETFVPVYYKIKEKEGLYRVAVNHNNLPLEALKKWNSIKGESVKSGTRLIVGYLKVKKELSPLAGSGTGNSIGAAEIAVTEERKRVTPEVEIKPVAEKETKKIKGKEKDAVIKTVIADNNENVKTITEAPVSEKPKRVLDKNSGTDDFKALYEQQEKNAESFEVTGNAGVFKSTSGWTDRKYYCLYNSASTGTIIKITNPANGKFVFAKVLDLIPDINQNEGLLLVISNAAADALGATEGNFNCAVKHAK